MNIVYLDVNKIDVIVKQLKINQPLAMAIGYFDGLHRGHMELVNEVLQISKKNNMAKALFTYNDSPGYVLGFTDKKQILTSIDDKAQILKKLGFDYLFVLVFDKQVSNLTSKEFVVNIINKLNVKHLVCGFDNHYGKNGLGNANTYQSDGNNKFVVTVVDSVNYQTNKISSTYIKELLSNGNIPMANMLLSRIYSIKGVVVKGNGQGNKNGFPTANIDYGYYYLPKKGVYAVEVIIDNISYRGMANIGNNPTYNYNNNIVLEVNIFRFNQNIYDKVIKVCFIDYIREEKKFESINDLYEQIKIDKELIESK